ncbi:MAG: Fic family protein [Acidobacteria bacterium]|jgi:Fic family protein|nr:Fic family protein [Acidobacteriota bacterium]
MHYIWQYDNWPNFTWQYERLLEALGKTRFTQGKLLCKIQGLGFSLSLETQAAVLTEEAIKTASIEGQELNRDSVRSSVARHLGLSTVGLPIPDRHADGLVEMLLDAAVNYNKPLTAERLQGWQAALFPTGYSGLHRIRTGEWRGPQPMQVISGPIGKEKIHFEAPPADRIEKEMEKFFAWWTESMGKIEGLLRAGIAHFYFITIHPFEDGNGRIARALTDMALAQDEKSTIRFYSLANRIMTEREKYYDILEQTQKGNGDITAWLLWFLGCLERAIEYSETLVNTVLIKANSWQKYADVEFSRNQRKVINRLLDAGPSGFEGGLTTRKYVSMTKVSRATAYREISDLVTRGILAPNEGKGRNISYRLVN